MQRFILGFTAFFKGLRFSVFHFRLWFLLPIFIWLLVVVAFSFQLGNWLIPRLNGWFGITKAYENTSLFMTFKSVLKWGAFAFVQLLFWFVSARYMKYFVLLILSPLFAYLSQRTDEILTGRKFPFNFVQFLRDIQRGIIITFRNAVIETILMAIGLVISFIFPVTSPLVLVLLFLVNCYFMAFNFFDYVVERQGLDVKNRISFMRSNVSTLLGFGFAYNLVSAVPFLDWVLAPISASSGAVIAVIELNN